MSEIASFFKDLCIVSFFVIGLAAVVGFVVFVVKEENKQCQIYLQNDPSLPIYREFINPTELKK